MNCFEGAGGRAVAFDFSQTESDLGKDGQRSGYFSGSFPKYGNDAPTFTAIHRSECITITKPKRRRTNGMKKREAENRIDNLKRLIRKREWELQLNKFPKGIRNKIIEVYQIRHLWDGGEGITRR